MIVIFVLPSFHSPRDINCRDGNLHWHGNEIGFFWFDLLVLRELTSLHWLSMRLLPYQSLEPSTLCSRMHWDLHCAIRTYGPRSKPEAKIAHHQIDSANNNADLCMAGC